MLDQLVDCAVAVGARLLVSSPAPIAHLGTCEHADGVDGIIVPPLRDRMEDLPLLVQHYCRQLSEALGRPIKGVEPDTCAALRAHDWPGNLDELHGVLERAAFHTDDEELHLEHGSLAPTNLGSYQLVSQLASGAMGDVWLARHRLLARPAAVKLLNAKMRSQNRAGARRLFEREARATAELTSPHTVRLYDFGFAPDGAMYYVMELLEGLDLRQLVEHFGPLPPERVVHIARQVCDSLAEAHTAGLIHQDIKPSNLFLCKAGTAFDYLKVLDFGVVRALAAADVHLELDPLAPGGELAGTPDDSGVRGTPAYASPEAITGTPTHISDLYSLGATMYHLLTGQAPFQGRDALTIFAMHLNEPLTPIHKIRVDGRVGKDLQALVEGCLSKSPIDRPPSAVALRAALTRIVVSEPWTQQRAEQWWTTCADQVAQLAQSAARTSRHNTKSGTAGRLHKEAHAHHKDSRTLTPVPLRSAKLPTVDALAEEPQAD